MGPVPRRGTHAPVRAPHGEHADVGQDEPLGLVARPRRRAEPGPGVGVKHRARDAGRLPYKLGSSRRVPRTPSTLPPPKLGPKGSARTMTHVSPPPGTQPRAPAPRARRRDRLADLDEVLRQLR